jgi:hypothetical protein
MRAHFKAPRQEIPAAYNLGWKIIRLKELALTIQGSALAIAVASILSCEMAGVTPKYRRKY